jgi:CRISPR-associated protein Cas5t
MNIMDKKYLILEAVSQTASFRIPEFHNYHKTLPLPPFTTLVGIAGAALGKEYQDAQKYFETNHFLLGVYGISNGFARDLWKAKSTKTVRTIIRKEYHYDNYFVFVYGCDKKIIDELYNAFSNSVYALTVGNSDSLLKILALYILDEDSEAKTKRLENCLLLGNYIDKLKIDLENMELNKEYIFTPKSSPVSYNLPNSFIFLENNVRKIKERKEFTFIKNDVVSGIEFPAVQFNQLIIPVFEHKI